MQITLTPDIESALTQRAQKVGKAPEQLALDLLYEQLAGLQTSMPKDQGTLADFLADYIGAIRSSEHRPGGAQLSDNTGKHFAAVTRQREQPP